MAISPVSLLLVVLGALIELCFAGYRGNIAPRLQRNLVNTDDNGNVIRPFTSGSRFVFQSIVTFEEDVSQWSDNRIAALAEDGYNSMVAEAATAGLGNKQTPNAFTAIIRENKVYFSSSLKGGSYIYIPQDTIKSNKMLYRPGVIDTNKVPWTSILEQSLAACQIASPSQIQAGHRYGANCGEPMAALMFARDQGWHASLEGAVIVTWGPGKDNNGNRFIGLKPPCDTQSVDGPNYRFDSYGCAQLTAPVDQGGLGMRAINSINGPTDTTDSGDVSVSYGYLPGLTNPNGPF